MQFVCPVTVPVAEPEAKFVTVTVVAPRFAKLDVVKVPVPGLPAVKIMVAVFPVAAFGALRLKVTVYVPEVNVEEVKVTAEPLPWHAVAADAAAVNKLYERHTHVTVSPPAAPAPPAWFTAVLFFLPPPPPLPGTVPEFPVCSPILG